MQAYTYPCVGTEAPVRTFEPLARLVVLTAGPDAAVVVTKVGPAVSGLVCIRKTSVVFRRLQFYHLRFYLSFYVVHIYFAPVYVAGHPTSREV